MTQSTQREKMYMYVLIAVFFGCWTFLMSQITIFDIDTLVLSSVEAYETVER